MARVPRSAGPWYEVRPVEGEAVSAPGRQSGWAPVQVATIDPLRTLERFAGRTRKPNAFIKLRFPNVAGINETE